MSFSVERIDHVEVFVRDLKRSAEWYAQVLGLREVMRWDPEPVMIESGGTKLALFRAESGKASHDQAKPHWHRVAWLTDVAGFAVAQEHLKALGIAFRGPVDHGRSQSIYFEDPDRNLLEITCYP
jgi:catechol 2,3-dioxygenase-like lactoylglutathione lyase family enzyme